jgi:outer membrane biosynthesis protein TonB
MSTATVTYSPELPWVAIPEDERRFRRLALTIIAIFLFLSIVMPFLPLPELPKREVVELPPRVAELILQRKQRPPPPPKVAKVEPKKPEKKKPEPKKPEPKKQEPKVKKPEKKPEPKKQTTEQARKKAAGSGILAFSDQLADLRDLSSVTNLTKKPKKLTQAGEQSKSAKKVTAPTRSIVTSSASASQGSGGIATSTVSTNAGGTQLAARTTSRVEAPISTQGAGTGSNSAKQRGISRTAEEITDIIDKNKGSLFRIYNRELRSDPTLKGKVVLEITIAPSGKVMSVKLVSSELSSPKLERKLVARIKLIDFGRKEVETVTTTLPIDFFPA